VSRVRFRDFLWCDQTLGFVECTDAHFVAIKIPGDARQQSHLAATQFVRQLTGERFRALAQIAE
jgi:hypothetical protein